MIKTPKSHTLAALGAVLALALMPVLVDSAYAETDEVLTKIQNLQEQITAIQERSENLDLGEKKLIAKYQQKVIQYEVLLEKAEQKQETEKFIKSELERLNAEEEFQEHHTQVYVANDKDRGKNPDNTLVIALNEVVEKENYGLVSAGMDKMINQYRDTEVKTQLQEYKTLVLDAMDELEEVDNQNTEVLALTSGDIEIPANGKGFGKKYELFTPAIIKNELKQQIKTAVKSTKILADKISEEHKAKYKAAKKIADVLSEDGPKYPTKGLLNAIAKLTAANEEAEAAVERANKAQVKLSDAKSALEAAEGGVWCAERGVGDLEEAVKALEKAQKDLNKAERLAERAQSNAEKASAEATAAEERVEEAKEKARQDAKKKAQKDAIDAANAAADRANAAQERADDLAAKAAKAANAAEGADPDSNKAKKAQNLADKAQKAADKAQKLAEAAEKKKDQADAQKA